MVGSTDHSTWCHSILEDLKAMLKGPIDTAKSTIAELGKKFEGMKILNDKKQCSLIRQLL